MGSARNWLSRCYYANRAKAGRIPGADAFAVHDRLIRAGTAAVRTAWQGRLRELLCHAAAEVPYWQDLFASRGIDPTVEAPAAVLARLPILDKPIIRAEGDRMISRESNFETLHANASGGSTGSPLQFFQDRRYLEASLFAAPFFDQWTGWQRGEPVALLWGAPTDLARYGLFRERIRNTLQNRFLVDAFDINDAKLDRAVQMLQRRKPQLVVAYASAAYLVARHLRNEGIRLHHPPRGLIASAEVLWPHYREVIEDQFACKVYNRYGSREVGLMAMECSEGRMHINATDVVVEVEDPDERGVGPLVVTQLHNFAFPFIRYRIGDLGCVRDEPCPCGRTLPVLSHLSGRVGDHIVAPDGTIIHGEWFTHLFYDVAGVVLFTFRQTDRAAYVFDVQRGPGFEPAAFEHAVTHAREKLGAGARLDVHFVESFEASPSGKHRFVVNECTPESDKLLGALR